MNQYISDDQLMMLQNHTWVNDPFRIEENEL